MLDTPESTRRTVAFLIASSLSGAMNLNPVLPATAEREAMDRLEGLLSPVVEKKGFSMLTLVPTGENLREWTYYTTSEEEFLRASNSVLAQQPRFPIEVHAERDPKWLTYERFRKGVRE